MIAFLEKRLEAFPRVPFVPWTTPVEQQVRLSEELGVSLSVKRDDLTGLAFGGNKVRQLEYYFGQACTQRCDVVLITGAVQSNFVRAAAACGARVGMSCLVQLEERVSDVGAIYRRSGNVLLNELLGATVRAFPRGEDEEGADQALEVMARRLQEAGKRPYVIHLGANHPPYGSLGYVRCAGEILSQTDNTDAIVVGSGSGQTHAGLLFGLRARGWNGPLFGICVRRSAESQRARVFSCCERIAELLGCDNPVLPDDVLTFDDCLAPGYGRINKDVSDAISKSARLDGLILDPVYTGRMMAGLFSLARRQAIRPGASVLALHSGGLPAVFAYETELRDAGALRPGELLAT